MYQISWNEMQVSNVTYFELVGCLNILFWKCEILCGVLCGMPMCHMNLGFHQFCHQLL